MIPPSNLHGNVRMSVLLGELNRIQHRSRPRLGKVHMEDYLCSRPMIEFDDEAKLIRAQADRLMRYIYTKVPTRERHPFGVLTTYDRPYTVPDDRYSSPQYLRYHRDIPSNILNMSYYYEPSRVTIGRGHLSCVSYAGGRGYPRRKHLYSDENRDIGDEIRFRSYYNKVMNPKKRAEALLLPTGFASRLLLTERNRYDPQEDARLLFITPIKKSSAAAKEKREKKKLEGLEEKPRNAIGDSAIKKPKKETKEIEIVEKAPVKLIAVSPEPEENVECSATIRVKSPQPQEVEPEPAPVKEPEPEIPKEDIKEPEIKSKPSKKAKKDSKVSNERLDLGPQRNEEAEQEKAKEPEVIDVEKEVPKQLEVEKETPKEEPQVEAAVESSPPEVMEEVSKEEIPAESNLPEVQEPVTPVEDNQAPPPSEEIVEIVQVDETPSESLQEEQNVPEPVEEPAQPQPEQISANEEAANPESKPDEAPSVAESAAEPIAEPVAESVAEPVADESEANIPDTSSETIQDPEPVQISEEGAEEQKTVEEIQEEPEKTAECPQDNEASESIPESIPVSENAENVQETPEEPSELENPADSEITSDPVVE